MVCAMEQEGRTDRRSAGRTVVLVYGPVAVLFLLLTLVVGDGLTVPVGGRDAELTLAGLVQEPTAVGSLPPWTGLLSTLGGVLLCCAGAVAVAAAPRRADGAILRELGAFSVLLGLDDLLQLHESVVPGITGLPEEAVFGGYALVALLLAVRHRTALRRLVTPVAVLAVLLLAGSVALDLLDPALRWQSWSEDTLKLLGFTGWAVSLVSWTRFRRAQQPRGASTGIGAGLAPSGTK